MRQELVNFLQGHNYSCDAEIAPGQPFLLNAWHALGQMTTDVDSKLPQLLQAGVPTGVSKRIDFSGVWEPVASDADIEQELLVHREPWECTQMPRDHLGIDRQSFTRRASA